MRHLDVRPGAGRLGDDGAHGGHLLLDRAAAGDVVRVAVRVQHVPQGHAQFLAQPQVAVHHLQHRVDEDRFAAVAVGDEVRYVEEPLVSKSWRNTVGFLGASAFATPAHSSGRAVNFRGVHRRRRLQRRRRAQLLGARLGQDEGNPGAGRGAALDDQRLAGGGHDVQELVHHAGGERRGGHHGHALEGQRSRLHVRLRALGVAVVVEVQPRLGAGGDAGGHLIGGHVAGEDHVIPGVVDGAFGEAHRAFAETCGGLRRVRARQRAFGIRERAFFSGGLVSPHGNAEGAREERPRARGRRERRYRRARETYLSVRV